MPETPNTPEPVEPWLLAIDAQVKRAKRWWQRLTARPAVEEGAGEQQRRRFWASWSSGEKVAAVALVVILVGLIAVPSVVSGVNHAVQAAEQRRLDAEHAEAARIAEEERQEDRDRRKEETERKVKEERQQALKDAPDKVAEIDVAIAAAPWAEPSDIATLTTTRDKLAAAADDKDGVSAASLIRTVPNLISALGTQEQADERTWKEHLAGAYSSMTAAAARTWCTDSINKWNADRAAAAVTLREQFDAGKNSAVALFCPDLAVIKQVVDNMITDGKRGVGGEGIQAGTWRTIKPVSNCYWERSTGGGEIIDNNFISHAPDGATVTVYDGEGFTTERCGLWERIG